MYFFKRFFLARTSLLFYLLVSMQFYCSRLDQTFLYSDQTVVLQWVVFAQVFKVNRPENFMYLKVFATDIMASSFRCIIKEVLPERHPVNCKCDSVLNTHQVYKVYCRLTPKTSHDYLSIINCSQKNVNYVKLNFNSGLRLKKKGFIVWPQLYRLTSVILPKFYDRKLN